MVVACLGELGEEVDAAGVGLFVVREAVALDLFDLAGSFVGAVQCEEGYWVYALVEANSLGEKRDWVLPE